VSASLATAQHVQWVDADQGGAHALFAAEGMRCAACARSIERALAAVPGVSDARVNVATHRVSVDFDPARAGMRQILEAVERAGFHPLPLAGPEAATAHVAELRTNLKRIGVAGLGMMQTMMFVFALYTAGPRGIEPEYAHYFKLIAMLVTIPVLLYSGAPILRGAWASIRARSLGMDVPVAIALLLAFAASVYHTLFADGDVYYDSITMFVFFLLTGRYFEMRARQTNTSATQALARSQPQSVNRIRHDGSTERVPLAAIAPGDRLPIPKGGVIPVDATLESDAWVDQALITGESAAIERRAGERVPGGAVNCGAVITVTAQAAAADSTLATIARLLERAQRDRPALARTADRYAARFIGAILVLAVIVVVGWLSVESSRAFPALLAVLVVTCPCALSLATPVALASASTRIARDGVLITRADAIERLAAIDTVVLDKTGTLTEGDTRHIGVAPLADITRERALALAAALERQSTHPIAQALQRHGDLAVNAAGVVESAGRGLEGQIDGAIYRIGKLEFVSERLPPEARAAAPLDSGALYLADDTRLIAAFEIADRLRPGAAAAVAALRELALDVQIASGDHPTRVARVATALGIDRATGGLSPDDKIALVHELQRSGRNVLMLGDGINDGPVLAAANVSCAMGQGSALAQSAADLLLLDDSLRGLARATTSSRRALHVMRQNLGWAFAYNIAAVPAAALGFVPPWLAALGMSLSSLAVVLNAARLTRGRETRGR
jgi:Cu2+-exporting ATPase